VRVRLLLDEDVPAASRLATALGERGLLASTVDELRSSVFAGARRISDSDVCREAARIPTVLVTLNVRDYADPAFVADNVIRHGLAIVIVRVPKSESKRLQRSYAVHDIVHRHAHRIVALYKEKPVSVSATRRGFRRYSLAAAGSVKSSAFVHETG